MKAVIFDMDGVIIDSEQHWKKQELNLFGELLGEWTKEDQHDITGLNVKDTYEILTTKYGLPITYKEYMNKVENIALDVYRNKANLLDGLVDLLKELKQNNIPTALASSSLKEWIEIVMDRFDMRQYFDILVSAEEINAPGKPAPDIYLITADKLGVKPENCIVFEDSTHGATAANKAGMFCIGLRNGFNKKQDLSMANIEIHGFKDIDYKKLSILNF